MFDFLKKKGESKLFAPVTGRLVSLSEVADEVFASGMMGHGVAFVLSDGIISSPCDGTISLIAETKHAFGVTGPNGVEVLTHIGLDTVALNGEGFDTLVAVGSNVKKGDPVIKVELEKLKAQGIDLTTPMIIMNSADFNVDSIDTENVKAGETPVMSFTRK